MVNLNVGPPLSGMPTLKPLAKDSKEAGTDSFGKELELKLGKAPGPKLSVDPPKTSQQKSKLDEPKEGRESEKAEPQTKADPKEAKAEAEKAKPDTGQKKSTVKASDREKAIKKFMDSFESEFEIPSTRLVEAIAKLDDSELTKTPEETADAVIDQLGLDEADADRARAMYASLLVDLSKAQPAAAPAPQMIANSSMPSFTEGIKQRSLDANEKRSLMNAGIDRMNQSFWAKPGAQEPAVGPMANAMAPQSQALSRMMVDEGEMGPEGIDTLQVGEEMMKAEAPRGGSDRIELPPHLRGQLESNLTPALAAALAARQAQMQAAAKAGGSQAQAAPAEGEAVEGEDAGVSAVAGEKPAYESAGFGKAEASVGASLGALAGALSKQSDSESSFSNSNQQGSQDDFAKAMTHQKASVKAESKLVDKDEFKAALGTDALNSQALPAKTELHAGATATAVAGANLAPASAEHDANVRQLMNQAQYLVKKGGGEVKVEMTPEGMGPVQLRVMVKDGKVQVQMHAETAEAKKVIESGLAELKTSLAAHKLSVDHIKVDVVNGTNNDTATNNQQNLNQGGMQREGTRQFWNQFNENFGSPQQQRESFADITDLKGYTQKRDPLQPLENSSARSRALDGRGRGVNVVA